MSNGSKILKWILLSPVILVLLGILFCEINKAYWDHRVDELCAKDGGVTIYEKVVISKTDYPDMKFTSTGQPILPFERNANLGDQFFLRYNFEYVHDGFPSVERSEKSIVRRRDGKVLGRQISYSRGGGDFPTGFEESRYICDNWKESTSYFSSVLVFNGEL